MFLRVCLAGDSKGSGESHVFKGKHDNTDDDELIRRKKLCVCDPCFAGQHQHCLGNALDGGLWCGEVEQKTLVCKAVKEVATTRSAKTFEELLRWKIFHEPSAFRQVDNVVAMRVHTKERTKTEEVYYLAKLTGPMVKLAEGGMHEGNWHEKGVLRRPDDLASLQRDDSGQGTTDWHTASSDKCTMQLNGVMAGALRSARRRAVVLWLAWRS